MNSSLALRAATYVRIEQEVKDLSLEVTAEVYKNRCQCGDAFFVISYHLSEIRIMLMSLHST